MSSVRDAVFSQKKNTISVEKYDEHTVYSYVYSDDISGVDLTRWPIVYTWDSGVSGDAPVVAENPLTVKSLDMKVHTNTTQHHTDRFAICQSTSHPQLVVRRGQSFNIDIKFSRPYDSKSDAVKLIFEAGDHSMVNKGTEVVIDLSLDSQESNWHAKIVSVKGNIVSVDTTPPANCYVARWRFTIHVAKQQGSNTIVYLYQHATHIYILFNPWCKEDEVHFADQALLSEYVLNPAGIMFTGSSDSIDSTYWHYGQFDSSILDIALDVLELARMSWSERASPIIVTRSIAAVVNHEDESGVIFGKWEGSYSDGVHPLDWRGSTAILEQFSRTQHAVMYGQCWVFAGVVLTISRALGIPSRCITGFDSAHDNDGSLTVDVFYDAAGNFLPHRSETIWNFHTWNEAWMARPDLPAGYGGWQAFDATPQGTSDGFFRRGPASVKAVKEGEINHPYDGPFHFAEVNGDLYNHMEDAYGFTELTHILKNHIGKFISTKAANSDEREDVTASYKFEEGSAEEAAVMLKAGRTGSTRPESFKRALDEKVEFTLVSDHKKQALGSPFEVSLVIKNKGNEKRTVNHGHVTVCSMYYNGRLSKQLKKLDFKEVVLNPGEEKTQAVQVTVDEYFQNLKAFCTLNVSVTAQIETQPEYFITNKVYTLQQPKLTLQAPKQAKVDQPFNVEVSFVNPYESQPLTECFLQLDGLVHFEEYEAGQLNPGGTFRASIPVTATTYGNQGIIVAFTSKELKGIAGQAVIQIQAQ